MYCDSKMWLQRHCRSYFKGDRTDNISWMWDIWNLCSFAADTGEVSSDLMFTSAGNEWVTAREGRACRCLHRPPAHQPRLRPCPALREPLNSSQHHHLPPNPNKLVCRKTRSTSRLSYSCGRFGLWCCVCMFEFVAVIMGWAWEEIVPWSCYSHARAHVDRPGRRGLNLCSCPCVALRIWVSL